MVSGTRVAALTSKSCVQVSTAKNVRPLTSVFFFFFYFSNPLEAEILHPSVNVQLDKLNNET